MIILSDTQSSSLSNFMNHDYSITFATYNQWDYTEKCISSLLASGVDPDRIVVVDNQSTDQTREKLKAHAFGGKILNKQNYGCGTAWNQGVLHLQSEWSIVMNNDVVVADNWVNGLIDFAERRQILVVSPAMIEGDLDYDFKSFSRDAQEKMQNSFRPGFQHAVCLAVHRSVWKQTGFFVPDPNLLGFEDTLFFKKLDDLKIPSAICGSSWIHHFGSITQKAMKLERGIPQNQGLGARSNKKLLNMGFFERKYKKLCRSRLLSKLKNYEIDQFGQSLHGIRESGSFRWI